MLQSLSIRDIVLIDRLDLELAPGLSVLTGETGAGKSILLDALGLAIGARAESGLLRPGAGQASAAAEFAVGEAHAARAVARDEGLLIEGNVILRRQLGADGRSRAFVNDQPVSVNLLRRLGQSLVEIEGQFEQQGLMDSANHRDMLDAFGGLTGEAAELRRLHQAWRSAAAARAETEAALRQARRDEDFLRHAVAELTAMAPKPGEEATLAESRRLLMNREKLVDAIRAALADLGGERGAEMAIGTAQRRLDRIADKAGEITGPIVAALDRAAGELGEATAQLTRILNDPDLAPHRLEQIEERLFALRDLGRKHAVTVDDLAGLTETLAGKLAALDDQGDNLARLSRDEATRRQAYAAAAEALSKTRRKMAGALDRAVNAELPPLKLEKAKFQTRLDRLPEEQWSDSGVDRIMFEVSTNPGMSPGPLGRVASGGELSRLLLALKVVLAKTSSVATLVFDEVDSAVGGATAAAVGERLARLGRTHQVLVVTHSPQVAARGDRHWRIEKTVAAKNAGTVTRAIALDVAGRREEIARMLAGATITEEARAAADRLMVAPDAKGGVATRQAAAKRAAR